jgi:hypothetical protein
MKAGAARTWHQTLVANEAHFTDNGKKREMWNDTNFPVVYIKYVWDPTVSFGKCKSKHILKFKPLKPASYRHSAASYWAFLFVGNRFLKNCTVDSRPIDYYIHSADDFVILCLITRWNSRNIVTVLITVNIYIYFIWLLSMEIPRKVICVLRRVSWRNLRILR